VSVWHITPGATNDQKKEIIQKWSVNVIVKVMNDPTEIQQQFPCVA
jgi:hypothetical protein